MFNKLTAASFVIALTLPVTLQAAEAMDTNADGLVSPEEFATAHPDAKDGMFEQIDVNADGALEVAELAAARDAGILPAS